MKIIVTYDIETNTTSIDYPHLETDEAFAIRSMHSILRDLEYALKHKIGTHHTHFDANEGLATIHTVDGDDLWEHQEEHGHTEQEKIIRIVPKNKKLEPNNSPDDLPDWLKR